MPYDRGSVVARTLREPGNQSFHGVEDPSSIKLSVSIPGVQGIRAVNPWGCLEYVKSLLDIMIHI